MWAVALHGEISVRFKMTLFGVLVVGEKIHSTPHLIATWDRHSETPFANETLEEFAPAVRSWSRAVVVVRPRIFAENEGESGKQALAPTLHNTPRASDKR